MANYKAVMRPALEYASNYSLGVPCLWGESDHPAFSPPASFSLHLASSSITPGGGGLSTNPGVTVWFVCG